MISTLNVVWGALAASILIVIGIAITRRLVAGALALPLAPVVGWAVYTVLTLPLYRLIGFFTDVSLLVARSEEHTSELQSRRDLVCRLLLEKKKKNITRLFLSQQKKKHISTY